MRSKTEGVRMIAFIFGIVVGAFIGIGMVALVSVNRFEEDTERKEE